MKKAKSVLLEAEEIINGVRRQSYGDAVASFNRIATMWSAITGTTITAQQVCLCMVALKISRELHKHHRDNVVDICGYAALLEKLNIQK